MGRLIFEYIKTHPKQAKQKRGWDDLNSRNFDPQSYVEAGKDINATDHAGNTILYWASHAAGTRDGDAFIRTILAQKPDVNRFGSTPPAINLIHAAPDILEELEQLGINWNAQNASGVTALWSVAVEANLERVQYLLTRGAEPNVATIYGTPLHGIADDGVGEAPVKAVRGCVEVLVAAGANLEAPDPQGNTPLMLAVQNYAVRASYEPDDWSRYVSLIEILLTAGASPECRAREPQCPLIPQGATPLMCQRYDKGRMHRALLKAGADPVATCDKGRTAIDYARLAMKRKKVYAEAGVIERVVRAMERAG